RLQVALVAIARQALFRPDPDLVEAQRRVRDLGDERSGRQRLDGYALSIGWDTDQHQSIATLLILTLAGHDQQQLGVGPQRDPLLLAAEAKARAIRFEARGDGSRVGAARLGGAEGRPDLAQRRHKLPQRL